MLTNRLCPVCSCSNIERLQTLSFAADDGDVLPTEYVIVACRRCGFVYDQLAASKEILSTHYARSTKYVRVQVGGSGDLSEVDKVRYQATIDFCKPYVGPEASVVDVGCGKGGLLFWFQHNGYKKLMGVEPSMGCVEYTRKVFGIHSECADIEHLPSGMTADLVVISNVFEHLWDPIDAARSVDGIVKEGGYVCVEVPDGSRYDEFFYAPYYSFDMEHINHFDLISMENLWGRLGYRVLDKVEYVGMPVEGRSIPMLRVIVQKATAEEKPLIVSRACEGISRFINLSRRAESALVEKMASLRTPVCYWGCGAYAKWFLNRFEATPVGTPEFIVDRSASGDRRVGDIPVVRPEVLFGSSERKAMNIVVTSVLYENEIGKSLIEGGCARIYSASTGERLTR